MRRLRCLLVVVFLIFAGFVSQSVNAQDEWDGDEIEGMLQTYYGKISEDFNYESDITEIGGSFMKNPTTEDSSNIIISVDFSKDLEEFPGDFTESTIGQSTIFHLSEGPTFVNNDWMTYTSRSYSYCGEYRVYVDAYVSLTENLDSQSTYIDLMDKYAREYLSSMIETSLLCRVVNQETENEVNEDIQVRIIDITGEVEIKSKDSEFYVVATVGDLLGVGDRISTGFESEAVIEVNSVATMIVKEVTNFSVSQLFYDGNLARTAINLGMGSVTTSVKPEKGVKASFQIVTPTATIGVRGTEFSVSYDEAGNHTYVYVLEGSVDVSNLEKSKTEIVNAGYYAYISSEGDITVTSMEEDYSFGEYDSYYGLIWGVGVVAVIIAVVVVVIAVAVIITVVVIRKGKKKKGVEKEESVEKSNQ